MPQKVDPFIPVQTPQKHTATTISKAGDDPNSARPQPPRQNLDQLRPWHSVQKPRVTHTPVPPKRVAQPLLAPVPQPIEQPIPIPSHKRASRIVRILQAGKYALLSLLILAAGMLLQITLVGELLIAAYAVLVLVRHIESRTTFVLALVSFAYIILMLFVHPDPSLMKNFAMYAFLFLAIGAFSLLREARY